MSSFSITVHDQDVQSLLARLGEKGQKLEPVLETIGTKIIERTHRRFDTSTGPDGQPWKPNSAATIAMLAGRLGKSYRKKNGDLNAKGRTLVGNKRPLIGESGDLRRQIVASVVGKRLTVVSTPVYAAIQQFGGNAGRGHKVAIPARPFMPIREDGSLYPNEKAAILQELNDYLLNGLG